MDVMPTRMVKAGETVFQEGDEANGLYYICYGTVEISRAEGNGQRVLAELSEGSVFGEMAMINSKPRNATVTAKSDCGFYTMNRDNFQHQVEQLPTVMRGVFRIFVLTIRDFLKEYDAATAAEREMEEEKIYTPIRGGSIGGDEPKGGLKSGQERKLQF